MQQRSAGHGGFFVPHDLDHPIRGSGSGPLAGLTAAVKDMYDIAGTRTGAGSPEWLATHEPAPRHAPAIETILAAGATIVGKAICEELFFSVTGINAHYGAPANVRAPGRMPGGSSSGSAAAAAAGSLRFCSRQRHRRIRAGAGLVLRALRHPADPWAGRSHRRRCDGAEFRHRRLVCGDTRRIPPRRRRLAWRHAGRRQD